MSVMDIINSGGSQFTLGGSNYDPKQYNVNGQEVGQTQLSDGRTISTDFSNDSRTDQDHKQDLVQATQDVRSTQPRDEENFIYGGTSNHPYEKVHNTRADQMETAFVNYMVAALNPKISAGQAVMNAGQALFNQQAVVRRQDTIDELESKGYNPQDIEKYIQTGKPEDLIATKGKEIYDAESGTIYNPLTGVVRYIGVSGAVQQRLDTNKTNAYSQMQQTQYNIKKPLAELPQGTTALMPDLSVVTTQPKEGGGGMGGSTVNYNEQLGTYGYFTQLPSGERAFVHTSNRGVESKSGSNMIYDIVDDTGNRIRTETGPASAQGSSGRNLAIMGSSTEALGTAKELANMHYNASNTFAGPIIEGLKRTYNDREQSEFESINKQLSTQTKTVLADRAVQSTTPRAVLQADMKIQTEQGGKSSVYKTNKEDQRIFNQQLDILAGAQVAAEYNDTHGGRSMPLDQYEAAREQRLHEILSANPELLNAFGQKPGSKDYTDPTPYMQNTNQPNVQQPIQQPQSVPQVQNGMNRTRRGTGYTVTVNP